MGSAFTPRHVLVTRPEPGLFATMAEVTAQGWHALASPVMDIRHNPTSLELLSYDFRAIMITSAQSLPFLSALPRDSLLLTVGHKTAQRAKREGFENICAADGHAQSLIELCKARGLGGERLILASGTGWDGRVYGQEIIEALGAKRYESYQVSRRRRFNSVVSHALCDRRVEAILFYSSETVASFISLCEPHHLAALRECRALCFSDAIAQKAQRLALWKEVESISNLGSYHLMETDRTCILKSFMNQEQKGDVPQSMARLPCYMQGGGDCRLRGCLSFLQEIYS